MAETTDSAIAAPLVALRDGRVRGEAIDGLCVFRGIPYAAPPVGTRRFRPPQPVDPWEGVLDATRYGAMCAQVADPLERYASEPRTVHSEVAGMDLGLFEDEDCLNLNVWTPACDEGRRPVLVFVHGGAHVVGTASTDFYTGEHLARHDVVVVTFNYRLGVFGYLELGSIDGGYQGSGNNGLRDQLAALEWVQANIAAFGGDPDNVTVFGESAGSISICALLATSAPGRLFHRAIAQSGGVNLVHAVAFEDDVTRAVTQAAALLGVDDLLTASTAQLLEVQTVAYGLSSAGDALWGPYVDHDVVLGDPHELLASGHAANVSLLAGATHDEMSYWSMYDAQVRNPFVETTDFGPPAPWLARSVQETVDAALAPSSLADVYREWIASHATPRGRRTDDETARLVMAHDYVMIEPMTRLAEACLVANQPVWLYRFCWTVPRALLDDPGDDLGAVHALELPFVFGTLDLNEHLPGHDRVLADPTQRAHARALAESMQRAWTSFARGGDPNGLGVPEWPRYDRERRATLVWRNDADGRITTVAIDDPEPERRRAWAAWPFPPFGGDV